jgi:hypothetical protein
MAKKKGKRGGKKKKASKKKKSSKKKATRRGAGKKKAKKKKARPAKPRASYAGTAAQPSTAATPGARIALNPAAAWPFPTGSRP